MKLRSAVVVAMLALGVLAGPLAARAQQVEYRIVPPARIVTPQQ